MRALESTHIARCACGARRSRSEPHTPVGIIEKWHRRLKPRSTTPDKVIGMHYWDYRVVRLPPIFAKHADTCSCPKTALVTSRLRL